MAQRGNLYRRPSGIYVLRITVPVRYRALIGQREIHASTRTTHLANAKAIATRLLEKWYASLEEFKQVDKEKIRETPRCWRGWQNQLGSFLRII
ncbi:DUF6538 domain-containing protein [Enterobacter asburiae]